MNARWAATVALLVSVFTVPAPSASQDVGRMGSRILSLESWSYDAIEGLRLRGFLTGLNPLSQPYRRIDVAAQLARIDGASVAQEPLATWVDLLRRELAPELRRLSGEDAEAEHIGFDLSGGAAAADSRRRDPLVPYRSDVEEDFKDRAWPIQAGGVWLETHNIAAEANLSRDWWHRETHGDPDGLNPGGFKWLGRSQKAYLTVAQPWGNVWVGRLARNWGPLGQTGFMVGTNPTTYPSIGLDLGRGRFTAQFMAGELEELEGRRRYLVGNRIDYDFGDAWVSLGESVVYSGQGSTLRLINPLEVMFFDHNANNDLTAISGNVMVETMFWARVGEGTVYGEFTLDDFDLNARTGTTDRGTEATSYHAALGGRWFGVSDQVALGADYRRVSGWSYRSGVSAERWTYLERGLGDPWSDYDRLTLRADFFPSVAGLRVSPVVQYQRKGEGDYREGFPPPEELFETPGIFQGVTETTKRVAVQGRYQPRREAFLEWDVGRSFISNADHVPGVSEQRLSLLVRLGLTFGWSGGSSGGN